MARRGGKGGRKGGKGKRGGKGKKGGKGKGNKRKRSQKHKKQKSEGGEGGGGSPDSGNQDDGGVGLLGGGVLSRLFSGAAIQDIISAAIQTSMKAPLQNKIGVKKDGADASADTGALNEAGGDGGGDEGEDPDISSPPQVVPPKKAYKRKIVEHEPSNPVGVLNLDDLHPVDLSDERVSLTDMVATMKLFGFDDRRSLLIGNAIKYSTIMGVKVKRSLTRRKQALLDLNNILRSENRQRKRWNLAEWFTVWIGYDKMMSTHRKYPTFLQYDKASRKLLRETEATEEDIGGKIQASAISGDYEDADRSVERETTPLKQESVVGVMKELVMLMLYYKKSAVDRFNKKNTDPGFEAGCWDVLEHCERIAYLLKERIEKKKLTFFYFAFESFLWRWCTMVLGFDAVDLDKPCNDVEKVLLAERMVKSAEAWDLFTDYAISVAMTHKKSYEKKLMNSAISLGESLESEGCGRFEEKSKHTEHSHSHHSHHLHHSKHLKGDYLTKLFSRMESLINMVQETRLANDADRVRKVLFKTKVVLYKKGMIGTNTFRVFEMIEYWIFYVLKFIVLGVESKGAIIQSLSKGDELILSKIESPHLQSSWTVFSSTIIESCRLNNFKYNSSAFSRLAKGLHGGHGDDIIPVEHEVHEDRFGGHSSHIKASYSNASTSTSQPIGFNIMNSISSLFTSPSDNVFNLDPATISMAIDFLDQ